MFNVGDRVRVTNEWPDCRLVGEEGEIDSIHTVTHDERHMGELLYGVEIEDRDYFLFYDFEIERVTPEGTNQ